MTVFFTNVVDNFLSKYRHNYKSKEIDLYLSKQNRVATSYG